MEKTSDIGSLMAENEALHRRIAELEAAEQKFRNAEEIRTQAELEERTAQILAVGNNLPAAMLFQVVWLPYGVRQFTYLSDGVAQLFGCTPAAALADSSLVYRKLPEEERRRLDELASRAAQLRAPLRVEVRFRAPTGELRWLSVRSSSRPRADGATVWDGVALDITEQKEANDAVKRSELKYRRLVDTADTGFVILDTEGRVLDANEEYVRLTGHEHLDEILCRHVTEWTTEESREINAHAIRRCLEEGLVRGLEISYANRQGGIVPVEINATVVRTGSGDQILTLCRDVTARKEAEKALRLSEKKYRGIVETTTEWIWEIDLTGHHTFSNPAVMDILGYRPEEFVGKGLELLHPEDRPGVEAGFARLTEERRGWKGWVVRWRHRDGTYRSLESNATPLMNAAGELVGYIGADRDITERESIASELRRSEARYRGLVEQSIAGIGLSRGNQVIFANRALLQMLGYDTLDELRSVPLLDHVAPSSRDLIRSLAAQRERGDRSSRRFEYQILRRDGEIRDLEIATSVLVVEDEVYVQSIFNDITERKNAQSERDKLLEALREANERKNEFLAMLSHELRNPLAPICNGLYVLERVAPGGEQARRALATIERQVGHLTHLVDDLLDVTRITRGKIQLQRERLDLNQVTLQAAEDFRAIFVKGGVTLDVLPAPAQAWVLGDKTRLAQAIGNLLQNAAKFTPQGGRTTVSVEADVPHAQAAVTVRDTGAGIAPEMMPRLFEVFSQADKTLDRSKGGLGLGLALVRSLVEMHGGSVSAASAGLDRGAVFTIRLPLEAAGSDAAAARLSARGAGAPRRIVVIEDNVDAADVLREALELDGHSVVVAYNGPDGIERAHTLHPDFVLCDIGLPGMDGYEVARTIRADPELGRTALVAITGYAGAKDAAQAREAGFDAHLAKPVDVGVLERLLERDAGHPTSL